MRFARGIGAWKDHRRPARLSGGFCGRFLDNEVQLSAIVGGTALSTATAWVDEQVKIPDLLRAAPQVRPVLDRYGLRGCGGPLGPAESLGFFARAHDVPVERLLHEVRASLETRRPATPLPLVTETSPADTIYRPFFKAAIVIVLTLGGSWGAYLLLRIGLGGSFTAVGIHEVNAHGHAQIFGWVGLFVMGFAYQAFPRFKHASLAWPRAAYASLVLLVAGLVVRSVLEPLAVLVPALAVPAVAGSAVEVVAIGLFVAVILKTWRDAGKPLALYDFYVLCALAWFLVQAVYETVYLAATLGATGADLVRLVATWQAPLRDIQIHGFALLIVLGVSQRLFPHFYGLPEGGRRRSWFALFALNAALLGEVAGFILMRTNGHAWAALWYASVLVLAGTVIVLVAGWRIYSPPDASDRSLKFLRAAYVWLFVSLAMLVLLPVYQFGLLPLLAPDSHAARLGFSHAYYGAIRHAITVGFISLMIVGVAAKVVPTLNGRDVRALSPLWLPFVLINGGCALRVAGQTLTDFTALSFPFTAVSGLFEVTGLAVWGVHLWRIMTPAAAAPAAGRLTPGEPVTGTHVIADVLAAYPGLLPTFVASGFHALTNPVTRATVARHITVEGACRLLGVDLERLLAALNAGRGQPDGEGSCCAPCRHIAGHCE
jgi:hypothetical protein